MRQPLKLWTHSRWNKRKCALNEALSAPNCGGGEILCANPEVSDQQGSYYLAAFSGQNVVGSTGCMGVHALYADLTVGQQTG